jgi:hypothetical protein
LRLILLLILAFAPSSAPAAGDFIIAGDALPDQGDCSAPGMLQNQPHITDSSRSVWSCRGVSQRPLTFQYESGQKEECLYIDNLANPARPIFIPLNTSYEWNSFKEAVQSPNGQFHDVVRLVYGCEEENVIDSNGQTQQLTAARNGTSLLVERDVYTCVAVTTGCGSWVKTADSASAKDRVDGKCGTANGGAFSQAPTEDLCKTGDAIDFFGTGPWTWICAGKKGGLNQQCSASFLDNNETVAAAAISIDCTFNGQTVADGASVTAYQSSSPDAFFGCVAQLRTCTKGVLSGTFTHASCSSLVSCTFNGQTVANGHPAQRPGHQRRRRAVPGRTGSGL